MPKQQYGPFYFFMKEFQAHQAQKGIRLNLRDSAQQAGPFWDLMDAQAREPYKNEAKLLKANAKKLTTTGIPIEAISMQKAEEEAFKSDMLEDIAKTISSAGYDLLDVEFYLIHINSFCFVNSQKEFYPAEIGISRFNLRNGVDPEDVFHSFINPGPLPTGYDYTVKKIAEDTHQIAYPSERVSDVNEVFKEALRFLSKKSRDFKSLPPVYAFGKNLEIVRGVIKSMCINMNYDTDLIKVYTLEHLFYGLKNGVANITDKPVSFPTLSLAFLELEKDVYDYTDFIACEYHLKSDVPNHCSKSFVTRWAYIICDHCCFPLNIPLIPGQHVPTKAKIPNITNLHSSFNVKVNTSNRYAKKSVSVTEEDADSISVTQMSSHYEDASDCLDDFLETHEEACKFVDCVEFEGVLGVNNSRPSSQNSRSGSQYENLRRPTKKSAANFD